MVVCEHPWVTDPSGTDCLEPSGAGTGQGCVEDSNCAPPPHGSATCQSGACALAACQAPWIRVGAVCAEPTGVAPGGACVSHGNCVSAAFGQVSCDDGVCSLACTAPWEAAEGSCIAPIEVPPGGACVSDEGCAAVAYAEVRCVSTGDAGSPTCVVSCDPPRVGDGDGACVAPVEVGPGGGCVSASGCAAVDHATVTCESGTCGFACTAPWLPSDNECVAPTDVPPGSPCVNAAGCAPIDHAQIACAPAEGVGGKWCTFLCDAPWVPDDQACVPPTEVPIGGACVSDEGCAQQPHGLMTCEGGACELTCAPPFLLSGSTCVAPTDVQPGGVCAYDDGCAPVEHALVWCVAGGGTYGICGFGCISPWVPAGGVNTCEEPSGVAVGSGCVSDGNCASQLGAEVSCQGASDTSPGTCVASCVSPFVEAPGGCAPAVEVPPGGACLMHTNCADVTHGAVQCGSEGFCILYCSAPWVQAGDACVEPTGVAPGGACVSDAGCAPVEHAVASCTDLDAGTALGTCAIQCLTPWLPAPDGSAACVDPCPPPWSLAPEGTGCIGPIGVPIGGACASDEGCAAAELGTIVSCLGADAGELGTCVFACAEGWALELDGSGCVPCMATVHREAMVRIWRNRRAWLDASLATASAGNPNGLYDAQGYTQNLLEAAATCGDLRLLDELAEYMVAAFGWLEDFGGAQTWVGVDGAPLNTLSVSQFLFLVSRATHVFALLPATKRSPAMNAVLATGPVVLGDHYLRWILDVPTFNTHGWGCDGGARMNPSGALTLGAWVRTTDADGMVALRAGTTWQLSLADGAAHARLVTDSPNPATGKSYTTLDIDGATPIADGTWHHVALTYDGATLQLWVDGALDAEGPIAGAPQAGTGQLHLGGYHYGSGECCYLAGAIDDVRLYERALSAAEVAVLANPSCAGAGGCAPTEGLMAYWPLDDATEALGHSDLEVLPSAPPVIGVAGNALAFDGVNDTARTHYWRLEQTHANSLRGKWLGQLADSAEDPDYCHALTDIDLWIVSGLVELLAARALEPALEPSLGPADEAALAAYLDLALTLVEGGLAETALVDWEGAPTTGRLLEPGIWHQHPEHAYTGYTGASFPEPTDAAVAEGAGWDISHARRIVHVFGTLHRSRDITGALFPDDQVLRGLARQWAFAAFDGDLALPLFRNFMDGGDGWYRVGYHGAGFGYGPGDLSLAGVTGGYGSWKRWLDELRPLNDALWTLATSTDPVVVAHREERFGRYWSGFQRVGAGLDTNLDDSLHLMSLLPVFAEDGAPPTCSPPPAGGHRSLWVWHQNVASDSQAQQALLLLCREQNIDTVYVEAESLLLNAPEELVALGAVLADHCIELELLIGYAPWALPANHPEVLALASAAVELAGAAGIRGLHLDIEPHTLPEWDPDPAPVASGYVDLLGLVAAELEGTGLRLSADIAFWYDGIQVPGPDGLRPLSERVIDLVDRAVLMDYRDHADGPDGIIAHASAELGYASASGGSIVVAVETNCGVEPEKVTFCEEGPAALDEALAATLGAFGGEPGFVGVAIHDDEGLTELLAP